MNTRDYNRTFFRDKTIPTVAIVIGGGILLLMAVTGCVEEIVWPKEFKSSWFLQVAVALGSAAWVSWGIRIRLDRRPWLSTDRDQLTAHRQPSGPLTLAWSEIDKLSLDQLSLADAELLIQTRKQGQTVWYRVQIGGLDYTPAGVYDHVLRCHAALGRLHEDEPEPMREDEPEPNRENGWEPIREDEPVDGDVTDYTVPVSAAPSSGSSQTREFAPKPRFPFDPRWISLILLCVGLPGIIIVNEWETARKPMQTTLTAVLFTSFIGMFMVGLVCGVLSLASYGLRVRPPAGWPRLRVSPEAIIYSARPDDRLEIPRQNVRNVVRIVLTYSSNVTRTVGLQVYYVTQRGAAQTLAIEFDWWEDPEGILAALEGYAPDASQE
jgi:hypothetical protein